MSGTDRAAIDPLWSFVLEVHINMKALPKWSQMFVTGKPVTVEQAREVIRRTDTAFSKGFWGNDQQFTRLIVEKLGIPPACAPHCFDGMKISWREFDLWDRWAEAWGVVETQYVSNSFVSTAFIGGPHGWCNPDGRIYFSDNIGKWPSPEAVLEDWRVLASEFPFLDLTATLMSGESCEENTVPLFEIRVCDGSATMKDAGEAEIATPAVAGRCLLQLMEVYDIRGCGIPLEWFDIWEEHGKKVTAEFRQTNRKERECRVFKNELEKVLRLHSLWLKGESGGVRADLSNANLEGAILRDADLRDADLRGADLSGANLSGADQEGAKLYRADLNGANLTGANLKGANLTGANLKGANLSGATLSGANLDHAILPEFQIPQSGDLVGFKKVEGGIILQLIIPDGARRTASLIGDKCRCERALVVRALNSDLKEFRSMHDTEFIYRVGEFVEEKNYDDDIREECKPGIHFFMKREEAELY